MTNDADFIGLIILPDVYFGRRNWVLGKCMPLENGFMLKWWMPLSGHCVRMWCITVNDLWMKFITWDLGILEGYKGWTSCHVSLLWCFDYDWMWLMCGCRCGWHLQNYKWNHSWYFIEVHTFLYARWKSVVLWYGACHPSYRLLTYGSQPE